MIDVKFEDCFDYDSGVIYYPVRHHSPACSFHLKKVIEKYKPECILIEGPVDADFLMPYLSGDGIKPPVCIYSAFDDKKGAVSEEKEKYRAYYPFLSYSPELTAIREANLSGTAMHFIDMPYALQLVQFGAEEPVYYFGEDNSELYYSRVADKSGCRSFSEFWEKGFEVNGLELDTDEFVKSVFMLGKYMRELSPADDRNRFRECFMRKNISEYRKNYSRVLVVAGAYHIAGLAGNSEQLSFKKYDHSGASLYLMPYSFAEADSRSGYGAGIPFPAFYSSVWEKILSGSEHPYDDTVQDFIIRTSRYARKKQHAISVTDEIQAMYMTKELAALRGKSQPGAFELTDGVKSAFVKGDITTAAAFELDFLFRQMTGLGAGEVNISGEDTAVTPPCVTDFRAQCRKYRINTGTVVRQQVILDVVKNVNHYHKSCFLHRMEYIGTGFSRLESGPDYIAGRDTSLVREQWSVRYNTSVEAKLIDLSVYGSSIEGICRNLLKKQFASAQNAAGAGIFLLKTYTLGFSEEAALFLTEIESLIRDDSDFISQCGFMTQISRLLSLQRGMLAKADNHILQLLKLSFSAALGKLEDMSTCEGEASDSVCSGLRLMYSITADYPEECSREEFLCEVGKCINAGDTDAQIYGVCISLYVKSGRISENDYCEAVSSYMQTAEGEDAAGFLAGMISVGRDIIFTNERVLYGIDTSVARMEREKFIEVLPQLRRAFTAFLPAETSRISRKIAQHYGAAEDSLSGSLVFSAEEILYASGCDEKIRGIMEKWGLLNGGENNE